MRTTSSMLVVVLTLCCSWNPAGVLPPTTTPLLHLHPRPLQPRPAYFVDNGKLFDPCGDELVLRGVNKMSVFADRPGHAFPEIASTGANAVRIMWVTSVPPSEAVQTLQRAVDEGLVPILELHDATGNFARMPDVIAWWTAPETIALLRQFENRLIANIANEAGDTVEDAVWVSTYQSIIRTLRGAGLRLPIMVDAADWGRGVEQLLRLAPYVLRSDDLRNVIFSWHIYDSGTDETARIDNAFATARAAGLALVVGEFGPASPGGCLYVGGHQLIGSVPYAHVVAAAASAGIGWLAWSWDNFNTDCRHGDSSVFDMVSDGIHAKTLVAGYPREVVIDLPGSIANTSVTTMWQQTGRCTPSSATTAPP